MNSRRVFSISFLDQPPQQWDNWFDTPVRLETQQKHFIFTGQVPDLAEFMGILSRFQLLNLDPVSIRYSLEPEETGSEKPAQNPANPAV